MKIKLNVKRPVSPMKQLFRKYSLTYNDIAAYAECSASSVNLYLNGMLAPPLAVADKLQQLYDSLQEDPTGSKAEDLLQNAYNN